MSKEEIKRLAKKSLEEKWYLLDVDKADFEDWVSNCAFCKDLKTQYGDGRYRCTQCYIDDLPICASIEDWYDKSDKSVIIKALEELAETGELTEETKNEVYK